MTDDDSPVKNDLTVDADELSRSELVELVGQLRDRVAGAAVNGDSGDELAKVKAELLAADDARALARNEAYQARNELRTLRQSITEVFKGLVAEEAIELDVAKEACDTLGADAPIKTFSASITVRLTVRGFQAKDEDDARSEIEDGVMVDFGSGEYDGWDMDEVEVELEED